MPSRVPRLSSRARAVRAARRLAVGALQRLAREVDRISTVLEHDPLPLPLRGTFDQEAELDVTRRAPAPARPVVDMREAPRRDPSPPRAATPRAPPPQSSPPQSSPPQPAAPSPRPTPAYHLPPGLAQVAHLRTRIAPRILALRTNVDWERADEPVESLRQLRVASRRLRVFLRLFGPMLSPKRTRRLRRALRRITRGAGPVREWDALLAGLRAAHASADPLPRAALEHVIAWAETQRREVVDETRRAIDRVDVPAVADALDDDLDRICGRLLRLEPRLGAETWALLSPVLERELGQLPVAYDENELEPLHDLRTRAKRLRYALELLAPTLGDAYGPLRTSSKAIQRSLGEHRDRTMLAALLRRHAEALAAQGLTTLADALDALASAAMEGQRSAYETALPALQLVNLERFDAAIRLQLGISFERPVVRASDL